MIVDEGKISLSKLPLVETLEKESATCPSDPRREDGCGVGFAVRMLDEELLLHA